MGRPCRSLQPARERTFPEYYSMGTKRLRWSVCTRGITNISGRTLLSLSLMGQLD